MKGILFVLCATLLLAGCGDGGDAPDKTKGKKTSGTHARGGGTKKFTDPQIEKLAAEANALLEKGEYLRAKAKMTQAYEAFRGRLRKSFPTKSLS